MTSIVKEGYLQKYSTGLFKGWKKRYFVLYSDGQFVFFDHKGGPRGGNINIATQCQDIQVGAGILSKIPKLPDGATTDCVFLFIAANKRFLLLADDRRALDSWLQVLNNARPVPKATSYPSSSGYPSQSQPNPSYPGNSAPYPAAPPPYSATPAAGQQPGTLGFEHLSMGPNAYPPQQQPGYPPQGPPGPYPPPQGYPPQGYPPQQAAYPTQAPAPYPPPSGAFPPGAYPVQYGSAYPAYPQGNYGGGYYPQGQAGYQYPPQQQVYQQKQKSGGLGGLGSLLGGAAVMGTGGSMLKKAGKHKKLIGGAAAAALGGYALHKATRRFSWSSGSSFGSFGSCGSFGSF